MSDFTDPEAVARYAEGPVRIVPGYHDLHRMAGLLLAEGAPADARILVLGAGGGLELRAFAQAQPGWQLVGVDPSREMLDLAARTTAAQADRITLLPGLVDAAPDGPFDGASCILTLHFVARDERLRTLRELRRRLRPGAPLVTAHHSFPQGTEARDLWLGRYAAFAAAPGVAAEAARANATIMGQRLPFLSPEEDEALLRQAGFADVSLFYAAFTFRGWIAR